MSKFLRTERLVCSLLLALAGLGTAVAGDRVTIVSEGATAGAWSPAPSKVMLVPGYPASLADKGEDVCVSVGYLLNRDGTTSDFSLLRSWGSRTPDSVRGRAHLAVFAQSAAAAVQRWRFVPVQGSRTKPKPVYTAASFAFSNNPATDQTQLRARCVITDLADFIARAQADAYKRGNLNKGRMDRARVENPPKI